MPAFAPGDRVVVIRSCLPGDMRLIGKKGRVVGTSSSGGIRVRFGPFWKARIEVCFPDELALEAML